MTLREYDRQVLTEAVDMIGRTGARAFEVGYHPLFDDDGEEIENGPASWWSWWAKATYRGAVIAVDDFPHPVRAAEALAQQVKKDAACARCGRLIDWGGKRRRHCWWSRVDGRWDPGCERVAGPMPP